MTIPPNVTLPEWRRRLSAASGLDLEDLEGIESVEGLADIVFDPDGSPAIARRMHDFLLNLGELPGYRLLIARFALKFATQIESFEQVAATARSLIEQYEQARAKVTQALEETSEEAQSTQLAALLQDGDQPGLHLLAAHAIIIHNLQVAAGLARNRGWQTQVVAASRLLEALVQ